MELIVIILLGTFTLLTPIFGCFDMFLSIDKLKSLDKYNSKSKFNSFKFRLLFSIYSFTIFILGMVGILFDISAHEVAKQYTDGTFVDLYTPINHNAIPGIIAVFLFSFLAYIIMNLYSKHIKIKF